MSDEAIEAGTPAEAVTDTEATVISNVEGALPESVEEAKEEKPVEKVFSQSELDAIVQKRLQKEERKISRRIEQSYQDQAAARLRETEPERQRFDSNDEYIQAQIDHLAEKKAEEKLTQRETFKRQEQAHEAFQEKAEKATEKYADFNQVISNPDLRINEGMAEFIQDSVLGTEVAYHLAKNPDVAARIAQMSPMKAAGELFRIENELKAPVVKVSSVTAPITPVSNRGSSTPTLQNSDFATYKAERAKQGARWAR